MRPIQLVTALLLQRNRGHIVDRLVTFDAQTAVWLDDSWHWLRRKRRSVERLARQLPWLRWLLLPFAALLLTGLFGTGYQVLRRPAPALGLTGSSGETGLSLHVERRGTDLLVTWNRNTAAILQATKGILRIQDGNVSQQELRLDVEQLRHYGVLYTPVSNNVQFRMEVSSTSREIVSESVLALKATPRGSALASQQPLPLTRYPLSQNPVSYAVQVGTFRDPANAERLRNEMEARYGSTRLASQASNPALWRVVVGRETTIQGAGRLAERIRSDGQGKITQALVIREADRAPRHVIVK